ncbi:hypothetical protein FHR24_001987 [Wenyingzhuangia heitensis]|uniref:Uncharacterized protein n=1 Tax=Wenyingzhuangia heitensis TaxID=1487859 RepID=A0ABX0UAY3_9FLAO|nr:hypothetical protein [Wenyingzhuangia heitensis]NIJ45519.1 hypothetical protein [Wenyingzhuangia heitensis]
MNKFIFTLTFLFTSAFQIYAQDQIETLSNGKKIILHSDYTWEYQKGIEYNFDFSTIKDNIIPKLLRQGISVNKKTLVTAIELKIQGWKYTMPRPKSSKAYWGNRDGRTTWYNGYWKNNKTNKYSGIIPKKHTDGYYYGDNQNNTGWRNGGSPSFPSKIEWLLSTNGGIKPR